MQLVCCGMSTIFVKLSASEDSAIQFSGDVVYKEFLCINFSDHSYRFPMKKPPEIILIWSPHM